MKLTCPACGAESSVDAWEADAMARRAMLIAIDLPPSVSRWALSYLALFRPNPPQPPFAKGGATRGLGWKRAARLLEQLRELVEAPEISWGQGVARPNDPRAWAQAMDQMCARPPKELPLRNHNYLRAIAYKIADQTDAEAERAIEEKRRDPYARLAQGAGRKTRGTSSDSSRSPIINPETQEEILRRNKERARQLLESVTKNIDRADANRQFK